MNQAMAIVYQLMTLFSEVVFVRHGNTLPKKDFPHDRDRTLTPKGVEQCRLANNGWWILFKDRQGCAALADVLRVKESYNLITHDPTGFVTANVPALYFGDEIYQGLGLYPWWEGEFAKLGYKPLFTYLQDDTTSARYNYMNQYAGYALKSIWQAVAGLDVSVLKRDTLPTLLVFGHDMNNQMLATFMLMHWPNLHTFARAKMVTELMSVNMGEACAFSLSYRGLIWHNIPPVE